MWLLEGTEVTEGPGYGVPITLDIADTLVYPSLGSPEDGCYVSCHTWLLRDTDNQSSRYMRGEYLFIGGKDTANRRFVG